MFSPRNRLAALGAPLVLGLGIAGLSANAGDNHSGAGPLTCEIEETRQSGMVTLQGVLRSDVLLSGSYRFRVVGRSGGGSSNISQGGEFTVGPGDEARLGQVTLGGSGSYEASLEITANGKRATCSKPGSAT